MNRSVQWKTELVLRLLKGDTVDMVSRESLVPVYELEMWKWIFLEQGTSGFTSVAYAKKEAEMIKEKNPFDEALKKLLDHIKAIEIAFWGLADEFGNLHDDIPDIFIKEEMIHYRLKTIERTFCEIAHGFENLHDDIPDILKHFNGGKNKEVKNEG